jgi:catechol 2,3-dioxygenase-like lactoylglutathione lyase family enzyme
MTERTKVSGTTTVLIVSDLQAALDFFGKLGFIEPAAWGEPPCFGLMNRDGFDIMLSLAEKPEQIHPNGRDGVWDLYINVDDLNAEIAALQSVGLSIKRGPQQMEYGLLEADVAGPDGHLVCFGQRL